MKHNPQLFSQSHSRVHQLIDGSFIIGLFHPTKGLVKTKLMDAETGEFVKTLLDNPRIAQ